MIEVYFDRRPLSMNSHSREQGTDDENGDRETCRMKLRGPEKKVRKKKHEVAIGKNDECMCVVTAGKGQG